MIVHNLDLGTWRDTSQAESMAPGEVSVHAQRSVTVPRLNEHRLNAARRNPAPKKLQTSQELSMPAKPQ